MVDTAPLVAGPVVGPVADAPVETPGKMNLPTLTAMVVGSMVGAGVFSLPARFGVSTGILGSLIAWAIAGTGMLMLAFVFQNLAIRKPDLNSGVFIYAKAGFGDYVGFNSAIGFWASAVSGNTFYWVFITATLGGFFPAFGDGDTVLAVALSTVGVWLFHYLIARGVRDAAVINRIVTVFKILPILVFIVVLFFAFDARVFSDNWIATGYGDLGSLNQQVRNTMLITTFVFIGIEGASVYSRYAKRREDVGRATILGFLSVLSIFSLVTPVELLGAAPAEDRRDPAALNDRGVRVRRRRVGPLVHQRGRHRLRSRRVPRLDTDGRRGDVHPGPQRGLPGFPRQGERQADADHRSRRQLAGDPGTARCDARPDRRAELHARPEYQPGVDPLLPRGRIRAEAGPHRRGLRERGRQNAPPGGDHRRDRHRLHVVPLRGRRPEVPAAGDSDPRASHPAVRQGA
jgi:hypothetical protein